MKIAIIGGGIAGLTAALTLKRKGIAFHLYEQCDEFKEVGAGVMLNESTFELLKILGVGDYFKSVSNVINSFNITDLNFDVACKMEIDKSMYSIHRADLIKVLSSALSKTDYTLGVRIEHIVNEQNKIQILTHNNLVTYDALIVANGIHSNIRKSILPKVEIRNVNQITYRGISKIQGKEAYHNSAFEFWGENKRFTVVHSKNDEYYWCVVKWQKNKLTCGKENFKSELIKDFKNFHPHVSEFIAETEIDKLIETNTNDINSNDSYWYHNRVVFIGDAIHCCTPDLSQGACMAIESAYTLGCSLSKFNSIDKAFSNYEQLRKQKVDFVKKLSYQYGRLSHQKKAWQYSILIYLLKTLPNWLVKKYYNKLTDIKPIM